MDRPENRADPFAVRLWPSKLDQPRHWKRPRRIFVNSMSDLFHKDVPDWFVRQIFEVMLEEPRHTYQVLTKRPGRALHFYQHNADVFGGHRIPGHIWMGATVENEDNLFRINQLRLVPAEVRWLSCEPLLGPVPLAGELDRIAWVVAGGESGNGYRPMNLDHARRVRDDCAAAGVAFLFKQVGGHTPKSGGRLLDGREWNEYPTN